MSTLYVPVPIERQTGLRSSPAYDHEGSLALRSAFAGGIPRRGQASLRPGSGDGEGEAQGRGDGEVRR
jgi:hypothetical protein